MLCMPHCPDLGDKDWGLVYHGSTPAFCDLGDYPLRSIVSWDREGWAHLALIDWAVPGRLQSVGGTSLQECWGPVGESSQETHRNAWKTEEADWWGKNINENRITWLNQDSRSIQLYKYLKNINLIGEGNSLWWGLGWGEKKCQSKINSAYYKPPVQTIW